MGGGGREENSEVGTRGRERIGACMEDMRGRQSEGIKSSVNEVDAGNGEIGSTERVNGGDEGEKDEGKGGVGFGGLRTREWEGRRIGGSL